MAKKGTLQITFLAFNVLFWAIGLGLVGFVSWTLSTLPSSTDYMSSAFGLLYAGLLLGIIIVLTGGFGCVGGMCQGICLLKTYIGFMFAFIFVEIGLGIGYHVLEDQVPDVIVSTWPKLNNDTKFTIQRSLECCGIQNYTEWSTVIDDIPASCFKVYETLSVSAKAWTLLFQSSCLDKIQDWFQDNLPVWASLLAFIALVQICSMFLSGMVLKEIGEKMKVAPEDAENPRASSMTSVQSGPSNIPLVAVLGTDDDARSNRSVQSDTSSKRPGDLETIEEEQTPVEDLVVDDNADENKSVGSNHFDDQDSGRPGSPCKFAEGIDATEEIPPDERGNEPTSSEEASGNDGEEDQATEEEPHNDENVSQNNDNEVPDRNEDKSRDLI